MSNVFVEPNQYCSVLKLVSFYPKSSNKFLHIILFFSCCRNSVLDKGQFFVYNGNSVISLFKVNSLSMFSACFKSFFWGKRILLL